MRLNLLLMLSGYALMSSSSVVAGTIDADTLSVRTLQELSVVGVRADKRTPMSYSNLDKKDIARDNLGKDIPFLLQGLPSVVQSSDAGTGIGYTSLRVRGVDASGINIMVNGIPLNDSESQAVFWVNMPDFASSLEELQLQRGVGTSSNGAAAFGASLNMRTEAVGIAPYAMLSLGAGSFGTQRASIKLGTGRIGGHWTVDGRLSRIKSNGYVDRASVDLFSYFLQASYSSGSTMLRYVTFGGKEVTGIAWHGVTAKEMKNYGRTYNPAGYMYTDKDGKAQYYHDTDNYAQPHHQFILTHSFSPSLTLNATAHYTAGFGYTDEYKAGASLKKYGLANFRNSDGKDVKKADIIRRKYLDNDFYGLNTMLSWRKEIWQISSGLSGNYYKGLHYGERRFTSPYPETIYPTSRYYDNVGTKLDLSSFVKANYQPLRGLNLYADLQLRHIDYRIKGSLDKYSDVTKMMKEMALHKKFVFFNPKAGVHYQLTPTQHFFASAAVAQREPNRSVYTEGSSNGGIEPKAEHLIDYELGYGFKNESLSLSANLYYMDYRDQLVANGLLSDVGEALQENVARSHRMGLELSAAYSPIKWLSFDAALALSDARIKEYHNYSTGVDVRYANTPISFSPRLVSSLGVGVNFGGFEAGLTSQFVGEQFLDNTGSRERMLPSYHVAGLRLGYLIPLRGVKAWVVNLQVNNLFNAQYASNGWTYFYADEGKEVSHVALYPQAGINVLVSTTLSF
ncbi:MAG: TonB-dependent receptor [Porphyromonadaceae bacterium]|nr:TonB-dependent receptor [Porphyromonadaceae bacterium]